MQIQAFIDYVNYTMSCVDSTIEQIQMQDLPEPEQIFKIKKLASHIVNLCEQYNEEADNCDD